MKRLTAGGQPIRRSEPWGHNLPLYPPVQDRLLDQLQRSLGAQYSVQREIGRGALGIVFLAQDQVGRAVALKVMGPDLLEAVGREAVLRELAIVTKLSHPHILPLLSCGDANGMLYLVTPYVVGGSLADRIAHQGHVPLPDALRIAGDIADAVSYAHRHNVIHRDITPPNVLLDGDHVFVKDFWIARALATTYRPQLFSKGVVLGSLPYMSPEQASADGDVGPRSDVYSLACLLFEMLTGRAPVSGPWAAPTRPHSKSHGPLVPGEATPTLPPSLVTAITRALAELPSDRFNSPQDFIRACKEAALMRPMLLGRTGGLGLGRLLRTLGRISKQEEAHRVASQALSMGPLKRLNDALQYRYEIKQQVGQGGMATVYLANDLRFSARKVALKVLRPEVASAVASERFIREIDVIARLTHPLILPLLDSGDADGMPFYVMPYLEGESLRETIHREGRLAVERALRVVMDVASALDYAHRQGVVHRDIKPDNIMLYEGQAMTTDFGIALALDTAKERLTGGYSPGTPLYMSPEQFWDTEKIDQRSDIYSLGCVLYEMVVGQPPYSGNSVQAIAANHLSAAVPHACHVRADLSEKVDYAICRALAKTPADRFPTAKDFAAALERTPTS